MSYIQHIGRGMLAQEVGPARGQAGDDQRQADRVRGRKAAGLFPDHDSSQGPRFITPTFLFHVYKSFASICVPCAYSALRGQRRA